MEFPHLGKHCSEKSCNQLDFLPMKCDACQQIFCKDHIRYQLHSCQSSYKKDVQVPVCPLCNEPVPWKRGELPDIVVGAHIDRDCQSDPAKQKRKVFKNKCSLKNCKQKEVVPIVCDQCKLNYCLQHRHAIDHSCPGSNPAHRAREAALSRASANVPQVSKPKQQTKSTLPSQQRTFSPAAVQGNLSEDEALARALQASLQSEPSNPRDQQEEADRMLALSLQQSERESQVAAATSTNSNNNCNIS
nr:EOG090X0APF [Cyclestheria hislopi]